MGQVRIVSGTWRGRKLPVPDAAGLRPTTDRTKETLFNWLMHDVRDSRCLDAFAGAGSLGFEALSRGASSVVFVEKDQRVAKQLTDNLKTLGASAPVICGDSIAELDRYTAPFDIVFIDPPFNQGLVKPFIDKLLTNNLLTDDSWVYVEHEAQLRFDDYPQLVLHREKRTPQFRYALYRFAPGAD